MGNEKQEKRTNSDYVDVFVYGMTSSGKDTVSDYLKSYFGMRKMRIAGTIKQIICEDLGCTFEQLEEMKRANPEIRMKHHEVSEMLKNQHGSLNRTLQIALHESFDLNIVDDPEKAIVVCDVRTIEEATILLDNDWVGIFLERMTDEFRHAGHFTENNMFENGKIIELSNSLDYADRMLLVFNDANNTMAARQELIAKLGPGVVVCTPAKGCTAPQLLETIDNHIGKWFK
jgi:hypothetical protein